MTAADAAIGCRLARAPADGTSASERSRLAAGQNLRLGRVPLGAEAGDQGGDVGCDLLDAFSSERGEEVAVDVVAVVFERAFAAFAGGDKRGKSLWGKESRFGRRLRRIYS